LAIGNIALCGAAIMTLRVGDTLFVDRAGNDRPSITKGTFYDREKAAMNEHDEALEHLDDIRDGVGGLYRVSGALRTCYFLFRVNLTG
jgi:hypothetical protein